MISRLIEIMAALRTPGSGCPWDLEQTSRSIAPYAIEEAYEVVDAIERDDVLDLKDELGDLLLQVVFHARMAEEAGQFAFDDVVGAICEKLTRRHPHVFANERGPRFASRLGAMGGDQGRGESGARVAAPGSARPLPCSTACPRPCPR